MEKGKKVYYSQVSRGGYGYTRRYPAVVVDAWPKTGKARIRLARVNTTTRPHREEPVERVVSITSLSDRRADVAFESVLGGAHADQH